MEVIYTACWVLGSVPVDVLEKRVETPSGPTRWRDDARDVLARSLHDRRFLHGEHIYPQINARPAIAKFLRGRNNPFLRQLLRQPLQRILPNPPTSQQPPAPSSHSSQISAQKPSYQV